MQSAFSSAATSPEDLQRGYTILETVHRESRGKNYFARDFLSAELAIYAPDSALKLAGSNGPVSEMELALIIARLAHHNSQQAATIAASHLPKIQNINAKLTAASLIGSQLAVLDPALGTQILEQAATHLDAAPVTVENIFLYVYAAMLATGLNQSNPPWFRQALDGAQKIVEEDTTGEMRTSGLQEAIVEAIAEVDTTLAIQAALDLPDGPRVWALSRIIQVLASKDVGTAQELLEHIERTPPPADPTPDQHGKLHRISNHDPQWAFGLSAKSIIPELGETDPAAALTLARRVVSPRHRADAVALAAQFQEKGVALALYCEATQIAAANDNTSHSNVDAIAHYAAQAHALDPKTGDSLFEQAENLINRHQEEDPMFVPSDTTALGFYLASTAPQQSRELLEEAFTRAAGHVEKCGSDGSLSGIALAMAALDIDRALSIATTIPEESRSFDTQRKIAQYVLAPPAVRRVIPFKRWCASDSWQPGTPTSW